MTMKCDHSSPYTKPISTNPKFQMVNSPHIEVCNEQPYLIQNNLCRIKKLKQKVNEIRVPDRHAKTQNKKLKRQISLLRGENIN